MKGVSKMKEVELNKEALQKLLNLIGEHPNLAERITIMIKPAKSIQGKQTKGK